ncbi:MAG TPA: SRPBCC family protein [Chryseosolibacter sp.]|nr:SRPBCC family protein [Chryseosolibacter sp.]
MNAQPVVVEKVYVANVKEVWEALTSKEKMKEWYFDVSDFKPVVGFEFQFEGGAEDRTYVHLCKVLEVVPLKRLVYTWRYQGFPGESKVIWELFNEGENKTRLKLTHEGLETFPQGSDFAKKNFVAGWTEILGVMLPDFIETGMIELSASLNVAPDLLWQVLTTPELINKWAQAFSEGTYVKSDFREGSQVEWYTKDGGLGARGVVVKSVRNQSLQIQYYNDVDEKGSAELGKYMEAFSISNTRTATLTIKSGPLTRKYIKTHEPLWEKAMVKIASVSDTLL